MQAEKKKQRYKQVCISAHFLTCQFAYSCTFDLIYLKLSYVYISSFKKRDSINNYGFSYTKKLRLEIKNDKCRKFQLNDVIKHQTLMDWCYVEKWQLEL